MVHISLMSNESETSAAVVVVFYKTVLDLKRTCNIETRFVEFNIEADGPRSYLNL